MAFSDFILAGAAGHTTSASSFTIATTQACNLASRHYLILNLVLDNSNGGEGDLSQVLSVTGGNGTWYKCAEHTNGRGAAAGGVTVSSWLFRPSGSNPSGTSITITLDAAVVDKYWRCLLGICGIGEDVGIDPTFPVARGQNIGVAGYPSLSVSGAPNKYRNIIRVSGKEANSVTAQTNTSGWQNISGTRSRNNANAVRMDGEYFRTTSTGATSSPTSAIVGDTADIMYALHEDAPVETETHDLTADNLSTGAPTLGSPSIGQRHALTATALSSGTPTLGSPTLSQRHDLDASALSSGIPTLGAPTIGQVHTLTASDLSAGAPELGSPVLGEPGLSTLPGDILGLITPTTVTDFVFEPPLPAAVDGSRPMVGECISPITDPVYLCMNAAVISTAANPAFFHLTTNDDGWGGDVAKVSFSFWGNQVEVEIEGSWYGVPGVVPDGDYHTVEFWYDDDDYWVVIDGGATLTIPRTVSPSYNYLRLGDSWGVNLVALTALDRIPTSEERENIRAVIEAGGETGGGDTDDLIADDLTTGIPTLGEPVIGQIHALSATGLDAPAPVLGSPAFAQVQALSADNLTTGIPSLGTPALGTVHNLSANALIAGAPTLGQPALSQIHALAATDLIAGTPTLGAPALSTVHAFAASSLSTGAPTLGSPSIAQRHILVANDLDAGTPDLGSPALDGNIDNLTAVGIDAGVPTLGSPAIGQRHALYAVEIDVGAPTLGSPSLAQRHGLNADSLTTGAPTLGSPAIGQAHQLSAPDLVTGVPTLGEPSLGSIHALVANDLTTGAPTLGTPSLDRVIPETPPERIIHVMPEARQASVGPESRVIAVPAEIRTITVPMAIRVAA